MPERGFLALSDDVITLELYVLETLGRLSEDA